MIAPPWTSRRTDIVVPARRDDVVVEELDNELILFDSKGGHAFHLNPTALAVWKHCDGRSTTRQIAEAFTTAYDVDFDRALDDVEQIVVFLARRGLLTTTP